jgi:DNA-binding CsgD family transcriptional regulator
MRADDPRLTDAQIAAWKKLTKRQRQCVEALRNGYYYNKTIARVLGLEPYTVAEHFAGARAILGVRSRIELALIAERIHHLEMTRERGE